MWCLISLTGRFIILQIEVDETADPTTSMLVSTLNGKCKKKHFQFGKGCIDNGGFIIGVRRVSTGQLHLYPRWFYWVNCFALNLLNFSYFAVVMMLEARLPAKSNQTWRPPRRTHSSHRIRHKQCCPHSKGFTIKLEIMHTYHIQHNLHNVLSMIGVAFRTSGYSKPRFRLHQPFGEMVVRFLNLYFGSTVGEPD